MKNGDFKWDKPNMSADFNGRSLYGVDINELAPFKICDERKVK